MGERRHGRVMMRATDGGETGVQGFEGTSDVPLKVKRTRQGTTAIDDGVSSTVVNSSNNTLNGCEIHDFCSAKLLVKVKVQAVVTGLDGA